MLAVTDVALPVVTGISLAAVIDSPPPELEADGIVRKMQQEKTYPVIKHSLITFLW